MSTTMRAASGSSAENLFISLFEDVFGAEKTGYLYSQYPFFDIYQDSRFADFLLENGGRRVAIEIDDDASHLPGHVSQVKHYDDLTKQNSMIHMGWAVYRWPVRIMQEQPERVKDELRIFLGSQPQFRAIADYLPTQRGRTFQLKEHQQEALDALEKMREAKETIALIHHATGTGKTVTAVSDAKRTGGRTLYIAHTKDLITQAADTFRELWPEASLGLFVENHKETDTQVICASVQSVALNLDSFLPDGFDYLIIDEAHHAAAETYQMVLAYFTPRFNLGNTPLHAAVKWSGFNNAKTLIALGVDVNAQNLSGKSALSDACRSAKKDMAVLLIRSGADINATDATGRTVLMDAISSNNEEMVRLLLQYKANVQLQEMSGRNAYHEAALTGNIGIINMIRKAGGNPLSRDAAGDTPFSLVLNADIAVIQAVLGADTTLSDSDGNTPVHIAVQKHAGRKPLMQLLNVGYVHNINQRNGKGLTALDEALANNDNSLALVLLEYGADPYLTTTSGESALTSVFAAKNMEILDAIVKYDSTKADRQGDGILHYAARYADAQIVKHLIEMKLDKKARNITGETPAQMAERWSRPEIAEMLK